MILKCRTAVLLKYQGEHKESEVREHSLAECLRTVFQITSVVVFFNVYFCHQ